MLLENKNAIIYGAGGAVGGAVARALARDGAAVFLAGRTLAAAAPDARRSRERRDPPRLRPCQRDDRSDR